MSYYQSSAYKMHTRWWHPWGKIMIKTCEKPTDPARRWALRISIPKTISNELLKKLCRLLERSSIYQLGCYNERKVLLHRATRRAHSSTVCDWQLSKISTRHIKGIRSVKFQLGQKLAQQITTVQLWSASDADFAGNKISRKSVCGGIIRLGDMILFWTCRNQASNRYQL